MGDFPREIVDPYRYKQFAYDASDNLEYLGENKNIIAADGDTDWVIYKFEYSSGNLVKRRKQITSWTLRASGWA